jgi:hypothetical protein
LKTPALCVDYLKTLFAKIAVSQSDFLTMQRHRTIGSTGRGEKGDVIAAQAIGKSSESSYADCQV